MTEPTSGGNDQKQKIYNMAMAALVGQVGCLTLIIIMAALFGGMYLDNRFDSKPWFTTGLLIGSIPISMGAMLYVSRAAIRKIKTRVEPKEEKKVGNQE
ncbi:MAG: AtpZ/AtpI family protein [Leptolinea sp.]|jgi:F0F1-type ATP synthase assembly protein I|nr:AtpZ/AtpI family protein [Leptolinea sp.]